MIPKPFSPIMVEENQTEIKINASNHEYVFSKNDWFLCTSLKVFGKELLDSKMNLLCVQGEGTVNWGETKTFVYSKTEEKVVVVSCATGGDFCVNLAFNIEYDGCAFIDLKIFSRGNDFWGAWNGAQRACDIKRLSFEIPIKQEVAKWLNYYTWWSVPNIKAYDFETGKAIETSFNSCQLNKSLMFPFLPMFWLGNENSGISIFAESDEGWTYPENDAFEIIKNPTNGVITVNLLNETPEVWNVDGEFSKYYYCRPVSFKFGFIPTPVRPFSEDILQRKILQVGCGGPAKKVKSTILETLQTPLDDSGEIVFDRIKRMGVTTVIMHEQWNGIQNCPHVTEDYKKEAKYIVEECHKRGIEVVPYFGYEISTLHPEFTDYIDEIISTEVDGTYVGEWYRKPRQRAYVCCYNSVWGEKFAQGVCELIEEMDFDGVYLDGTVFPWPCSNGNHGCGYVDKNGKQHTTFPIIGRREVVKKLYSFVESRNGILNSHISGCINAMCFGFAHQILSGEDVQPIIKKQGADKVPLDFFAINYSGRNVGTPNEFICYDAQDGSWTIESSLAFCLPHGVMPRAMGIGRDLEVCSALWAVYDRFGLADSIFHSYALDGNDIFGAKQDKILISYHEKPNGEKLVAIANLCTTNQEYSFSEDFIKKYSLEKVYGNNQIVDNGRKVELEKFSCGLYLCKKK